MKILKSKTSHLKKTTLKISDLSYNLYYQKNKVKLTDGVDKIKDVMKEPIIVFKHQMNKMTRCDEYFIFCFF